MQPPHRCFFLLTILIQPLFKTLTPAKTKQKTEKKIGFQTLGCRFRTKARYFFNNHRLGVVIIANKVVFKAFWLNWASFSEAESN